jgi:ATP-dependent protease ClpP protease subunit
MFLLPSEGFGLNFDLIETNILNLLVVLGVVIYLGGDVLTSLLNERKQKIFSTLKVATERFVEAEQKLAEAKQKIQIAQAKALGNQRFSSNEPIYLFLNTPGGSIQTGLEIIESLKGLDRPVSTVTLFAASMGFQIAQNL